MKNKFLYKDIILYLYKIINGKFTPFLENELDESKIYKKFQEIKIESRGNTYVLKLLNYLLKYYDFEKDIYLTNSGRDALYFILLNLRLKKKEIIIPSYSCLGLIEPILELDFIPRFVDIDNELNPSFESIKKTINDNTALVIIPHLGGAFARDTFKILSYCKKKKILTVEDCCQAFGLKYNKMPIGTFADLSFFSSGVGKPIFTPGGGWIVTKKNYFKNFMMPNVSSYDLKNVYTQFKKFNKKYSANTLEILKTRFKDKLFSLFDTNKNYFKKQSIQLQKKTMHDLSAFMILDQLNKLEENILKRKRNVSLWKEKLEKNNNLEMIYSINSIYNKLYINSNYCGKRQFIHNSIEVENGYKPLHLRYDFIRYKTTSLSYTEKIWKRIYSLPVRPSLDIDMI